MCNNTKIKQPRKDDIHKIAEFKKIHKAVTKQKGRRNKCNISGNLDIFLFTNTQNR